MLKRPSLDKLRSSSISDHPMSFSDSRPSTASHQDPQDVPGTIFSSSSGQGAQIKKSSVSNLTKNLLSSNAKYVQGPPDHDSAYSRPPPSYATSVGQSNQYIPSGSFGSSVGYPNSISSSFNHGSVNHFAPSYMSASSFNATGGNANANYIPTGHNIPNVVSSSYTSNNSLTPSFPSGHMKQVDSFSSSQKQSTSSTLPGFYKHSGAPTTNLSMDSANPQMSFSNQNNGDSFSTANSNFSYNPRDISSLPNSYADNSAMESDSSHRTLNAVESGSSSRFSQQTQQPQPPGHYSHYPANEPTKDRPQGNSDFTSNLPLPNGHFPAGPDHYMTYSEFLELLNNRDAGENEGTEGYEEHLNIVEFPVGELITMLACLLTKIIEANDKLHPNHFETTIAARQKQKESRKLKKLEKKQKSPPRESTSFTSGGISTTVSHVSDDENSDDSSDDEEDELKNRYLANVLAFHGTNVPGISLHAYLTRVLKYCPVTNEVFLSLLVYFDRIAKRANNLQKKKTNPDGTESNESEQLFVMDSYNIHRLIISGITVSSKFFSDIFYKNLRYAKVGGLPLEELNYLELQFLLLLDFKLMISVEDLQNYGDLLLKFWKREQLASEIVAKDTPAVGEPVEGTTS